MPGAEQEADFEGRVALVTGAARNIGRAIAIALAEGGASLVLTARSDREGLEETAREIRARGRAAEVILADVTKEWDVANLFEGALHRFGRLDILVNNAAVRSETPFDDMTLEHWHEILAVTLDGAFLCTRAALRPLTESGRGAVVNIGGLTAYLGAVNRAHVVAAKAGLDGLTKALAQEFAPRGITVNLVSPGMIDTVRGGSSSAADPAHHKIHKPLVGRRGAPWEVAAMVRHLCGPNGRFLTGQTIHVNGGAFLP
jgi:3-oxoacyl-[acyl-carrier protein] reductase